MLGVKLNTKFKDDSEMYWAPKHDCLDDTYDVIFGDIQFWGHINDDYEIQRIVTPKEMQDSLQDYCHAVRPALVSSASQDLSWYSIKSLCSLSASLESFSFQSQCLDSIILMATSKALKGNQAQAASNLMNRFKGPETTGTACLRAKTQAGLGNYDGALQLLASTSCNIKVHHRYFDIIFRFHG